MVEKLKQVRPEAPPYSRRYPQLARLLRENPGLPRGNRIAGNSLENQGEGARANRVRCAIASCCRRIGGLLPVRLTRGRPGGLARRLVALSAGKAGCSRTGIELVGVPGGAVVTDVELTGIRRRGAGIGAGIPAAAMLRRVAGKFASYLTRTWRSGVDSASAKRTFDVAVASVGLIFALPVMAVAAAAMRAASPGPILFRQQRIGRHGRRFAILKLRTMSCAGPEGSPAEKAPAEVTLPGRVLRRWSIDELPQLINVLKGEMSLVGPRPYPAAEALRLFGSGSPRTAGLPGITGLSQVSGRKELTAEEVLRLDREYLSRRSLPYDIVILARTLPAVIRGRGAY